MHVGIALILANYWHCLHSMQRSGIRPSVGPSVVSTDRCSSVRRVCCWAPGVQEMIDCCPGLGAQQQRRRSSTVPQAANAGSSTLTADVGSWTQTCWIVDFTAAVAVAVQAYFDAVYVCIAFNVLSIMTLTPAIVIFCIFRSGIQYFAFFCFLFSH